MPPETMLEDLQRALSRFASGPLGAGAVGLLETLGYRSERTDPVGGAGEFLDAFDPGGKMNENQRRLFASWRQIGRASCRERV